MEQLSLKEQLYTLIIELKEYAETKYDLARLSIIEKTAVVATAILMAIILSILVSTIVLFLSLSLAFYLGERSGNVALGFLWVGLGYFVISVFIYVSRSFFIRRPILRGLIGLILPDDVEEEDEDEQ